MENQKFAMLEEKINEIKFEIVESGLLTAGEEWDYKQVVSPFNRLYFILEGEGHIHNDMQQMDLKEGHLYLIPAGKALYTFPDTADTGDRPVLPVYGGNGTAPDTKRNGAAAGESETENNG